MQISGISGELLYACTHHPSVPRCRPTRQDFCAHVQEIRRIYFVGRGMQTVATLLLLRVMHGSAWPLRLQSWRGPVQVGWEKRVYQEGSLDHLTIMAPQHHVAPLREAKCGCLTPSTPSRMQATLLTASIKLGSISRFSRSATPALHPAALVSSAPQISSLSISQPVASSSSSPPTEPK